jgi:hypothetical protein
MHNHIITRGSHNPESLSWCVTFIQLLHICLFLCLMVFNATFNNISVISWRSALLVEETGGPGENHRPVASLTDKLYHIMLYTSPWSRFELTTSVVIGTGCIGSCKSNYHTTKAMTAPVDEWQMTHVDGLQVMSLIWPFR